MKLCGFTADNPPPEGLLGAAGLGIRLAKSFIIGFDVALVPLVASLCFLAAASFGLAFAQAPILSALDAPAIRSLAGAAAGAAFCVVVCAGFVCVVVCAGFVCVVVCAGFVVGAGFVSGVLVSGLLPGILLFIRSWKALESVLFFAAAADLAFACLASFSPLLAILSLPCASILLV